MTTTITKKAKIKEAHHRNRKQQRAGHRDRARWRAAWPTGEQADALRILAMETGKTFSNETTRGEAWRRIREATVLLSEYRRKACAPPWYRWPSEPGGEPPRRPPSAS